jgi:ribonuclease HII
MKTIYVDEVGCASIAGPVLTCAVAIDNGALKIDGVNDSKKLTKLKREKLYPVLRDKIEYAFGMATLEEIETLNVFWARHEAMKRAIQKLIDRGIRADKAIIDGKFTLPGLQMEQEAVIKADEKFWQVGAASILAKVKRDTAMANAAKIEKYSHYDWENNAGYYTPKHRLGIILHGPSDLHRKSFNFFKYCLARHKEYKKFIADNKTSEDYFEWVEKRRQEKNQKSDYLIWKTAALDSWQDVPYGGK